jgi:ADP-ribose pyrophosphatase YjhB (NUDIX family)
MDRQLQVGVKVFLRNTAGKYLLLQRSRSKYPEIPNRWDVVGGRIEVGTPLLDNLIREIAEETGMQMSSEPQLLAAQDILRTPERHVVRLTYIANTLDEKPILSDENDDFGWYTVAEMQAQEGVDIYAKEIIDTKLQMREERHAHLSSPELK